MDKRTYIATQILISKMENVVDNHTMQSTIHNAIVITDTFLKELNKNNRSCNGNKYPMAAL